MNTATVLPNVDFAVLKTEYPSPGASVCEDIIGVTALSDVSGLLVASNAIEQLLCMHTVFNAYQDQVRDTVGLNITT